jgi:Xaa-Pro aminopeptidase
MMIADRISRLRQLMKEQGIDAYIVPGTDPHQTEYVHAHWRSREWISGFTGSVGTVVMLSAQAGLWTDGRYFIQAENELKGSGIDLFKMQLPGVPELNDWIVDHVPAGGTVGVDGRLITVAQAKKLGEALNTKKIRLAADIDLITPLWKDRPVLPVNPARLHPLGFSGRTTTDKLAEIRAAMSEQGADAYLLSSLYDIAWLFNIRGGDAPMCPILTAYALVEQERAVLFADQAKLNDEIRSVLAAEGVETAPYDAVWPALETRPSTAALYLCEDRVSTGLHERISCRIVSGRELTALPKARKNRTELENLSRVQELDGVAMVRFWKWLEQEMCGGRVTECSAADRLEALRRDCSECADLSFPSISAWGPNAAITHYAPKPDTCAVLKPKGFYLIDSGGQYFGGTTDITRTLALGELSDEQRMDYTLVLKGLINLSRARFLKGTAGNNLDVLARQPLWAHGLDYQHGTGHGVGYYLNVHEGPQNLSQSRKSDTPLEPGMILTIEPGVYRKGRYGIRTENTVVVEVNGETEFGTFLCFRPLTLCPIDTTPLKTELLSSSDIEWLDEYHRTVREKLSPHLSEEEVAWLERKTQPVPAG